MKASEIVKNYLGGSLYLRGCDLNGVTLPTIVDGWLDLRGCDLEGVTLPTSVGGSILLSGRDLKGVTLPVSVGCSLYLGGCNLKGVTLPATVEGKPSKMIAFDGEYALFLHDDGLFSAGCKKHLTKEAALEHWNRKDARAVAFTAAINAV